MTDRVSLPPDLAGDLRHSLNGVAENRSHGPAGLADDLAAAHDAVFDAVDQGQEEPVSLRRETVETAAEWIEADINDHIEVTGDRPEQLVDVHRRLEVALDTEPADYSDDILAALDLESVMDEVSETVE